MCLLARINILYNLMSIRGFSPHSSEINIEIQNVPESQMTYFHTLGGTIMAVTTTHFLKCQDPLRGYIDYVVEATRSACRNV